MYVISTNPDCIPYSNPTSSYPAKRFNTEELLDWGGGAGLIKGNPRLVYVASIVDEVTLPTQIAVATVSSYDVVYVYGCVDSGVSGTRVVGLVHFTHDDDDELFILQKAPGFMVVMISTERVSS